jgi:hypothetical protein
VPDDDRSTDAQHRRTADVFVVHRFPEFVVVTAQRVVDAVESFGHFQELQIAVMGHYQSEQYTKEIFYSIIGEICPELPLYMTAVDTNPIKYL